MTNATVGPVVGMALGATLVALVAGTPAAVVFIIIVLIAALLLA